MYKCAASKSAFRTILEHKIEHARTNKSYMRKWLSGSTLFSAITE